MIDIQKYRADYIWHNVVTNITTHHVLPNLSLHFSLSPSMSIVIGCIALVLVLLILRKILIWSYYVRRQSVFLELTPPAFTEKSAFTTEQLFSVIHNIGNQRSIIDKILGRKTVFSLEIVSTREQGIRYVIRTTPDEASILKHNILLTCHIFVCRK